MTRQSSKPACASGGIASPKKSPKRKKTKKHKRSLSEKKDLKLKYYTRMFREAQNEDLQAQLKYGGKVIEGIKRHIILDRA